jgi:hypothetical protein
MTRIYVILHNIHLSFSDQVFITWESVYKYERWNSLILIDNKNVASIINDKFIIIHGGSIFKIKRSITNYGIN